MNLKLDCLYSLGLEIDGSSLWRMILKESCLTVMKKKRYRKTSAREEVAGETETQRKSLINRKCHEN